jgi:hypothetical protein
MDNQLESQIASYQRWRDDIRGGIEAYQAWLDQHGHVDIQRSLRIYDLLENLRNDRMVLAFLAEYSRGKTELINAMFFADFKQRLLPSDVGRTTMCPTEIFYDPAEEPYIRLLPIETRKREDSIGSLKQHPIEWVKIKLNLSSHEEMAKAMESLAETKQVRVEEASALALLDQKDFITTTAITRGSKVEIPAWRHAMINYPHPLLKSGLVILDTPGLNALGTEPELTLKMIPSAHAILFLLATDTGVTKSDMEIWQRYVQSYQTRRIAVLNKVDLLWDDLKTGAQIDESIVRQVESTCQLLELPREHVIALSAQKALLARIRDDAALLQRSGIQELENLLANEIVPAKQEILRTAVVKEMGAMVEASLQSVMAQLTANQAELQELSKLSGKNRELAKTMLARLEKDRAVYIQHMESFKASYGVVLKQGHALMANLDEEHIDEIFERSSKEIEGSWTTAGLTRSMNALFETFTRQADKILSFASETRNFVDKVYKEFQEKYGFANLTPPTLNLEKHILAMKGLKGTTEKFCRDPVNVMTEKHFLVRRFYNGLVSEARSVFQDVRKDLDRWLKNALTPISVQLKEHQTLLERRVDNLKKLSGDLSSLQERLHQLEAQKMALGKQVEELLRVKFKVLGTADRQRAAARAKAA